MIRRLLEFTLDHPGHVDSSYRSFTLYTGLISNIVLRNHIIESKADENKM
jgi:hypothetical protein